MRNKEIAYKGFAINHKYAEDTRESMFFVVDEEYNNVMVNNYHAGTPNQARQMIDLMLEMRESSQDADWFVRKMRERHGVSLRDDDQEEQDRAGRWTTRKLLHSLNELLDFKTKNESKRQISKMTFLKNFRR